MPLYADPVGSFMDYDSLKEDDSFHVNLGRGVWLMDDHRWALKIWEYARTKNQYSLVHADYHWDGCYDFYEQPGAEEELVSASAEQIAGFVANGELIRHDSFIAPAVRRGLIHTVHFYCLQRGIADRGLSAGLLGSCSAHQVFHDNAEGLASAEIVRPMIFDLCLDLFNRSERWAEGELWSDLDIMGFVETVSQLVAAAELVTVSLSFNYSGTADDTRHVAKLVVPRLLAIRADV